MNNASPNSKPRRRLAIIGGGSSGLITLKFALEMLPDWEIICFEATDRMTGCWGNPYPGFVSTSTKYTTQFACYAKFDADIRDDGGQSRSEFFRNQEYGDYLEDFAATHGLHRHVRLNCRIDLLEPIPSSSTWQLTIRNLQDDHSTVSTDRFDCVILCTGLAATPKPIVCPIPQLSLRELQHPDGLQEISGKRIVVIGGGESAVDYANRLADRLLNNKVFLSLYTGIRVSPRYHPIRGVPSDFLRNRLLLSLHEDLRNWIGEQFVAMRIRHQELFERIFPHRHRTGSLQKPRDPILQARKDWAYKLTKAAKADLFNMFHNKSDDFLDAVAENRITIIGPPLDDQHLTYRQFDSQDQLIVNPELLVPAIGYRSTLEKISNGSIQLADFYLGCCHVERKNLFLVGFARPIIGNIPTISEMQAQYVCGLIAGQYAWDRDMLEQHQRDREANASRFAKLNLTAIYPVEMFPYCDRLAKRMGKHPRLQRGRLYTWWKTQLAPATTMHYFLEQSTVRDRCQRASVYMPWPLIALLIALKPVDASYRTWCWLRKKLVQRKNSPDRKDQASSNSLEN